MDGILFSIVVPMFNGESFIEECIDSVIDQSYPCWQLIIVDDGSDDNSPLICKDIANKDNRLLVLSQNNQGPYNARMTGLKATTGDYVLFLDADDRLNPKALESLYTVIIKSDPDVVLFNLSTNKDYSNHFLRYTFHETNKDGEINISDIQEEIIKTNTINNLASKCIKRELLKDIQEDNIIRFRNGEDLYLCLPVFDKARKTVLFDVPLYFYRENNTSSTTHNYNNTFFDSIKRVSRKRLYYADKWGGKTLLQEAKKRCCASCLLVIRSLLASDLKKEIKIHELERIYNDVFFIDSIKYRPDNLGIKSSFLYMLVKSNNAFFKFVMPLCLKNVL